MPLKGPNASQNPLVAPLNWEEQLPRVEKRSETIITPHGKLCWNLYLTGGEGYVGRDGLTSGGIYGHDGQPFIQTPDLVFETHDKIHWHELRDIHKMFADGTKIPETVRISERDLKMLHGFLKKRSVFERKPSSY